MHKNYEIENPNLTKLVCGGFAGMTAISITYPTDLIRRRLQLQHFGCDSVPQYNGIIDCCKKIYKTEGIPVFYRGLPATWLKTGPAVAIQFWTIGKLNKFLKKDDI